MKITTVLILIFSSVLLCAQSNKISSYKQPYLIDSVNTNTFFENRLDSFALLIKDSINSGRFQLLIIPLVKKENNTSTYSYGVIRAQRIAYHLINDLKFKSENIVIRPQEDEYGERTEPIEFVKLVLEWSCLGYY